MVLGRVIPPLVRTASLRVARRAALSYIAGPELNDALHLVRSLQERGVSSAICPWDAGDTPVTSVAESYTAAQLAVSNAQLDCYVSIKAPSIQYRHDLLFQILGESAGSARLHFDSLGPETADPTFLLIAEALAQFPNLSCTLPGCWRRSTADAVWAVQHDLAVRVVKGQWPDAIRPVDMRLGFLEVIERLAGRARHVGVATHDPGLARESLTRLQRAGTSCELELLYGLPMDSVLRVAKEQNVAVRIYIPYGHAWLPYSLRQAVHNPRILFWILRDTIGRHLRGISSPIQPIGSQL